MDHGPPPLATSPWHHTTTLARASRPPLAPSPRHHTTTLGAPARARRGASRAAEARALKRVRHTNVIRMLGACAEPPMLLMELAPGGWTLRHALDDTAAAPPSVARRFHLVRGVCAGMAALHAHGVLHLDLKVREKEISSSEPCPPTALRL